MGRILIVDDDPNMLDCYKRIFNLTKYEILCVSSGEQALKKAVDFKPDIVLLDIVMPGINGYRVCEDLKNNNITKDAEVIFVSGKGMLDDRLKAYKVRASDFLAKPFSQHELLAKIELILERRIFYLELATTDGLTNLGNRKFFEERFENIYQIAAQYRRIFSIAILDIDHFKKINDAYGHDIGDSVLKQLSQRLKKITRKTDLLARIGGEEFAILLPEIEKKKARTILERLRNNIANQNFTNNNISFKVTISIGFASYPEDASDKNSLFKQADNALYLAKQKGRNRIESVVAEN